MDHTTQTTARVLGNLVIGGLYVSEQHGDEFERYLLGPEKHSFAVDFAEMLKCFRAALSLR